MRYLLFVVVWVMMFALVNAEEAQTLLSGPIEHGGYGGPVIKFTDIKGELGILVGGQGGWIINHTFVLGGAGYGLANEIEGDFFRFEFGYPVIRMGYGGLLLEYFHNSHNLVHFSVSTVIGAGGVDYDWQNLFEWSSEDEWNGDSFFVLEPELSLTMNITHFFRISGLVSYRFVSGVELQGLEDDDFRSVSGGLALKFGKF